MTTPKAAARTRQQRARRAAQARFIAQSVGEAVRALARIAAPSIEIITALVARSFCVSVETLKTSDRRRSAALAARQVAMTLACAHGFTRQSVARAFHRHHTAVSRAVAKYTHLIEECP